jgi:hypothetical protein
MDIKYVVLNPVLVSAGSKGFYLKAETGFLPQSPGLPPM